MAMESARAIIHEKIVCIEDKYVLTEDALLASRLNHPLYKSDANTKYRSGAAKIG